MSTWAGIQRIARDFSLREVADSHEIEEHFGEFANYVNALIRLAGELRSGGEADFKDIEQLEEIAQDMAESLLLAVMGMYSASAMVFRSSVENIFQYLADAKETVNATPNPVSTGRRPPYLPTNRKPAPGKIKEWLEHWQSDSFEVSKKLHGVYRGISHRVVHADRGNILRLDGFLRSLSWRDIIDNPGSPASRDQLIKADWLQNQLERGCVIGALVIKARFAEVWRKVFDGVQSDLNRSVEAMAARRDLLALWTADKAARS